MSLFGRHVYCGVKRIGNIHKAEAAFNNGREALEKETTLATTEYTSIYQLPCH